MRRPWLATTTTVLQSVLSLALIATAVILARDEIRGGAPDLVAVGILGMIGLPVAVSCWGLWKGRAWGWWLALIADSAGLITFLWDPITRRAKPDIDELAFIVMFSLLVLLLLLSPVRRFFLRQDEKGVEAGAGS